MSAAPAVSLHDVSRVFGSFKALSGIDLDVRAGEFFAMLGPSGSGKTTCLRLVAGFEQPTTGRISIFGEDVTHVPPYRRAVNTVFQDYALFPHLDIRDNVAYPLMIRKVGKTERRRAAEEVLSMVQLGDYALRRPGQLSGGQRQRVALARAIVAKPKVLLLDEPLGALDLKLRESMQEELKSLQRSLGITFVFVTHDQGEALSMADRIAVFSQGRIEQIGTPADIYERPVNRFVADFVGSSNVLPPEIVAKLAGVRRWASLRPEAIRVEDASRAESGLVGRLVTRTYLGASTRLGFELDGFLVHAVRPAGEQLPAGERMALRFAPDALHLMEPAA